jgi:hypothetical protein
MFKKLIYLVSFVFVLSIAAGAQATPIPVSVDSSVESVIGDDGLALPNSSVNTYDLQVRNYTQGRRVTLISFDLSGLKKDYQMFANMTLSFMGANSSGKVDVYGVIEDQDNISDGLKWNSAPGVNNGQPIGYPVDLDEADLTDKLLSFTSPARDERKSVGSAALDDFINTDTDGVVTLLLAPAGKGVNALMKSNKYSDGGVILEGEITTGKNIVFVSFHGADDAPSQAAADANFTEAPDIGYTNLLNADGHNVTRYITTGSPDPNVLNAADLVIISRSVASGGYSGDGATAWNSTITAPMIIMQGWALRSSRMGYTTGTTMVDITGDVKLAVSDPTHPIFNGIALTDGVMDNAFAGIVTYPTDPNLAALGLSINNDPVDNDGIVLATISEASADTGPVGGMVIAEWLTGASLTHSGGAETDALAGHRLVFLTGSRESGGITSDTAGMYDLSADGAQMLLNAVAYMIPEEPVDPGMDGIVAYYPLDGDALDASGNGLDGALEVIGDANAATFVDGVAGMAIDLLPTSNGSVGPYVNCGADPMFDMTDAITIGAWINIRSIPDEWRAIVAKGDNAWRLSNNGATSAFQFAFAGYGVRDGNIFSADGNIAVGFDEWHYICGTYDITKGAKLYVDGTLNKITPDTVGIDVNTNDVWIGGNNGDTDWKPYRLWDGMIDEVRIYNRALTNGEINFLAGQ